MHLLKRAVAVASLPGAVASLTAWALWLLFSGLLNSWEWSAHDARLRWRGLSTAALGGNLQAGLITSCLTRAMKSLRSPLSDCRRPLVSCR